MQCCVCKTKIKEFNEWICEKCEGMHHQGCSGDSDEGYGENPDESAYSICEKCINLKEEK